jgi:Ca-activated chloride channel family protein
MMVTHFRSSGFAGAVATGLSAAVLFAGVLLAAVLFVGVAMGAEAPQPAKSPGGDPVSDDVTQGALRVVQKDGSVVECPLKHTDVRAEISGFVARVRVVQTFANPLPEKIEAVYVFPLPHESAVDEMTLIVGDRRIVGLIKRRAEARRAYEEAIARGMTAALLEQERPNIFTQSVGNIPPKSEVKVEISYIDVLRYDQGSYEFHYPMVVGPRYIPGGPTSFKPPAPPELIGKVAEPPATEGTAQPKGTGWSPDTGSVPDASRITPPVLQPGFRTGHDISLELRLEAGVPVEALASPSHKADIRREESSRASVTLAREGTIPNKDFVLRYEVMGKKPEMALLDHSDGGSGYFLLMIQPKEDEALAKSPPREMVFLVDVSGSMSGRPTAKVKEAMEKFLGLVREKDTVQVIAFSNQARKLFDAPVLANSENIRRALNYTEGFRGGGGTEMLKGVRMAIDEPIDKDRVRAIILLTDGYIGNEAQIIEAVGRGCGDQIKFWCLGIGSSVNRFLVDGVARQGGGMGKVVGLDEDPGAVVEECMTRIQRAQLAKIRIDWGTLRTFDVFPARIPDLWAGRPVVLFGLHGLEASGKTHRIVVSGSVEGQPVSWPLDVTLPAKAEENGALAQVWARQKIEDLMQSTYYAGSPEVEEAVTSIALEYRLMSPYTSFVAIDEREAAAPEVAAKPPRRMLVPVPMPEGVSYEGVFGGPSDKSEGDFYGGRADRASGGGGKLRRLEAQNAPRRLSEAAATARGPGAAKPMTKGKSFGLGMEAKRQYGFGPQAPAAAGRTSALRSRGVVVAAKSAKEAPARPAAGTVAAIPMEREELLDEEAPARILFYQVMDAGSREIGQALPAVLKGAEDLEKAGMLTEARAAYARAWILDGALTAAGASDGAATEQASGAIEGIDGKLREAWAKELPALEKRLDLVIRDRTVPEALDEVARAAGLRIGGIPGSVEDAAGLLGRKDLRVSWLDLRGARVREALDWILQPAKLSWRVEAGPAGPGVAWLSDNRDPRVETAWVHDVSAISLPLAEELPKDADPGKRAEAAAKALGEFLAAVRKTLGLDRPRAVWYAPGRIVIFAGATGHATAEKLFRDLADPGVAVPADLQDLQKKTVARATARKESRAAAAVAREKAEVLGSVRDFSWPLLAASWVPSPVHLHRGGSGKIDDEALTELEIAWRSPQAAALLAERPLEMLRSAWAISRAAKALPAETRAAVLAARALEASRAPAAEVVARLEKAPGDMSLFFAAPYACMAFPIDGGLRDRARAAIDAGGDDPVRSPARPFILALLKQEGIDRQALAAVLNPGGGEAGAAERLDGEDAVLFAALACRRAGGEAWEAFRAASREILGRQPLPGGLVVLVSRLPQAPVEVAAGR